MKASRVLAALLVLALTTMAAPVWAVGPLDGAYALTLTGEGEELPFYLVVLQNTPQIVFIVLDPADFWYYGVGVLNAQQIVSGEIFSPDGSGPGPFRLQFGPGGSVTGTLSTFDFDDPATVSGQKVF